MGPSAVKRPSSTSYSSYTKNFLRKNSLMDKTNKNNNLLRLKKPPKPIKQANPVGSNWQIFKSISSIYIGSSNQFESRQIKNSREDRLGTSNLSSNPTNSLTIINKNKSSHQQLVSKSSR